MTAGLIVGTSWHEGNCLCCAQGCQTRKQPYIQFLGCCSRAADRGGGRGGQSSEDQTCTLLCYWLCHIRICAPAKRLSTEESLPACFNHAIQTRCSRLSSSHSLVLLVDLAQSPTTVTAAVHPLACCDTPWASAARS